jgi:hypothetical protein
MGVGALSLILYWRVTDEATRGTTIAFTIVAVVLLLVVRHED